MATRMWLAAYAGAAGGPATVRVRVQADGDTTTRAELNVFDPVQCAVLQAEPAGRDLAEWDLIVGHGPILTIQTPSGPMTVGPTRPATDVAPAEFHLAVVGIATTRDGEDRPLLISVERDGRLLTAVGSDMHGGAVADQVIQAPGRTIDLCLQA